MADLTHWDFAEQFSGWEAAALILGNEPRDSEDFQGRIQVVSDRMELHFQQALNAIFQEHFGDPVGLEEWEVNPQVTPLASVKLSALHRRCVLYGEETPLSDWFEDRRHSKFENQEFSRNDIANWLDAIGMSSRYAFRSAGVKDDAIAQAELELDPLDLPPELDAANMAYRAYTNKYGSSTATPKQWLIEYLEVHYPDFKPEQVQRIAIVANPDRSPGRKRSGKE